MSTPENVKLTSAEMASLWDAYISYTHTICILKYFKEKAEDQEVVEILNSVNQSLDNSKKKLVAIFQQEKMPVPAGFSEQDVDVNAPRLFSDTFSLMYVKNLARVMLTSCALMFTVSTRKDIRELFRELFKEGTSLFDKVSDVMLAKGIYIRPPFIEPPKKNDFVESKDYLSGNNFLKDQSCLMPLKSPISLEI